MDFERLSKKNLSELAASEGMFFWRLGIEICFGKLEFVEIIGSELSCDLTYYTGIRKYMIC